MDKKIKIKWVNVSDLIKTPTNPKLHPEPQIMEIVSSIKRFGFLDPILINEKGEIRAGHGRYEAAKVLEMKTVPCIDISHLSEADQLAFMLTHNKVAKSEIDQILEAQTLSNIADFGVDFDIPGYSDKEIESLLKSIAPPKYAEDNEDEKQEEIEENQETETAAGATAASGKKKDRKNKGEKAPAEASEAEHGFVYEIIFKDKQSHSMWYAFLLVLKDLYPNLDNVSDRISKYIEDNHSETITGLFPESGESMF